MMREGFIRRIFEQRLEGVSEREPFRYVGGRAFQTKRAACAMVLRQTS